MIDLHTHTTHSDGWDNAEQILQYAEQKGIEVLSFTDHNKISVYDELKNIDIKKHYSGKIINGCEVCCMFNDVSIEIIGYNMNLKKFNKYLDKWNKLNTIQFSQDNVNRLISVAQKEGLTTKTDIVVKKPLDIIYPFFVNNIQTFEENGKKLKKKVWQDKQYFFRYCICNKKSKYFVDYSIVYPPAKEVIDAIHDCGGICSLAHCFIYPYKNVVKNVKQLAKQTDLDCVECYHSLFTKKQMQTAKKLCSKLKLGVTGGSDYHGAERENQLATGIDNNLNIPVEEISLFLEKVGKIKKV